MLNFKIRPTAKAAAVSGDPYILQVVALLHFNGTGGSTTFTNSSPAGTPASMSSQNSPSLSTTSPKFGTAACTFPASSWVYSSSMPAPGTGDFTMECWVYPSSMSGNRIIFLCGDFSSSTGFEVYCDANGAVRMYSQTERWASANGVLSINTWSHVAITRAAGVFTCWVNGVSVASATWANSITQAATGVSNASNSWVGFIDEYRYTNGVARYTANFTAPVEAFPENAGDTVAVTWNPYDKGTVTLSGGNLTAVEAGQCVRAIGGKTTGKWYFEHKCTAGSFAAVGIATNSTGLGGRIDVAAAISYGMNGAIYSGGVDLGGGSSWAANSHIIGVAVDFTAGTVTFYKNGVLVATKNLAANGLTGPLHPICGSYYEASATHSTNFGASAFSYSPPAGHTAGWYL